MSQKALHVDRAASMMQDETGKVETPSTSPLCPRELIKGRYIQAKEVFAAVWGGA